MVIDRFLQQFIFWMVWLVIPFVCELFAAAASTVIVVLRPFKSVKGEISYYPRVTVLVPVYNSGDTLELCLQSVVKQTYPIGNIEVILIDNGSSDNSYEIFTAFQLNHPELKLWWDRSEKGKSRALNKGIFASSGKYVINIDSDGWLDRNALINIVEKFESDDEISCMTGVVLIDPDLIIKTKNKLLRTVQNCELLEYVEAFLVGRNFQSMSNSMYTLAGAFSCFRREVLMKTQMYNPETMGEDTHMTFQVKDFAGGRVVLCENAFFFTDPLANINKLYTQRQRWQRAQLEVASLFVKRHLGGIKSFFSNSSMRKLVSDHTLAFPRLIWFFAMIYLYFINYPLKLLLGANILIYTVYVVNSLAYMLASGLYLKHMKWLRNYIFKHWYICLVMPMYRFLVYWIRIAGIINSLTTDARWQTRSFTEEVSIIQSNVRKEAGFVFNIMRIFKGIVNREE